MCSLPNRRSCCFSVLGPPVVLAVLAWYGLFVPPLRPQQARTEDISAVERGKFRLHKFEQPIGEETYEIAREGDSVLVKSDFTFTDRGTPVPLKATLRTKQ